MKQNPIIKIRGYHLDVYGHVNNARYLEFMEEGRWTMFDGKIDLDEWRKDGFSFYVVNININYLKAAVIGDTIEVITKMLKLGNKSGVIRQKIVIAGTDEVCVDAEVTFVIVGESGRALPMEGDLKELLGQL